MTACATCGRDIVRRYVGSIEAWGHSTNPGPNHHDAKPVATSKSQAHEGTHSSRIPVRAFGPATPASRLATGTTD